MILSHFKGKQDRHKNYRDKVQQYAKEEKHLFEDLRPGLILGSKQFIKKQCEQHLPVQLDMSIPQQSQMAKQIDPDRLIGRAERILKCDVQVFIKAGRLRGVQKDNRDLLVYLMWRSGRLTNEQIGHAVKTLKAKIRENPELMKKFDKLNSQFKL